MKYKANALRNKAEISRLTPNQKEERHVQQLPPVVGDGLAAIGDPDIGLLAEIGAPASVVPEELLPKLAQNGGVQGVDVVRRRREAHLRVGEVENEVLALVANVVALEAEEEGQPVQEVHVRCPLVVRRLPEVSDGSERGGYGSDLREPERRVLREEVVDWDYVVWVGF
ncbi:hypothetical protein ACB094_06G113500 [Castanea mollissima]